ncbi:hypothetical protein, partial [Providencia stuartii]|uniref:hypothetical protein n=1 Tax=Providencia stuartii TaxID=588 RepID=UPI00381EEBE8
HDLAKVGVASSSLVSRSKILSLLPLIVKNPTAFIKKRHLFDALGELRSNLFIHQQMLFF